MVKFEENKTYVHTFISDSTARVEVKIIRRTVKSVWFENPDNKKEIIRKKITVRNGVETIEPQGSYSMAPKLYADKLVE